MAADGAVAAGGDHKRSGPDFLSGEKKCRRRLHCPLSMLPCAVIAAVVILAVRHIRVKRQLKSILGQLDDKLARLVTIAFVDDDVEAIALKINELLEEIQQTIIRSNRAAAALKSSIADISHDMKTAGGS